MGILWEQYNIVDLLWNPYLNIINILDALTIINDNYKFYQEMNMYYNFLIIIIYKFYEQINILLNYYKNIFI